MAAEYRIVRAQGSTSFVVDRAAGTDELVAFEPEAEWLRAQATAPAETRVYPSARAMVRGEPDLAPVLTAGLDDPSVRRTVKKLEQLEPAYWEQEAAHLSLLQWVDRVVVSPFFPLLDRSLQPRGISLEELREAASTVARLLRFDGTAPTPEHPLVTELLGEAPPVWVSLGDLDRASEHEATIMARARALVSDPALAALRATLEPLRVEAAAIAALRAQAASGAPRAADLAAEAERRRLALVARAAPAIDLATAQLAAGSPDQALYTKVLGRLVGRYIDGEALIDVSLRGEPLGSSLLAVEMLESIHEQRADLRAAMDAEVESWRRLVPWAQATHGPEMLERLREVRRQLTPAWVAGVEGLRLGWGVPDRRSRAATREVLEPLAAGASDAALAEFADTVTLLHRDALSLPSTYWMQLAGELADQPGETAALLSAVALAAARVPYSTEPAPAYDRSAELRRAALDMQRGLSAYGRRDLAARIWTELHDQPGFRDAERAAVAAGYPGIERAAWEAVPDETTPRALAAAIEALDGAAARSPGPQRAAALARHREALVWLRDVMSTAYPFATAAGAEPVFVSRLFDGPKNAAGQVVLATAEPRERAAVARPVSLALEQGGGRGTLYPQLAALIEESGITIDEYVGTSTGSLAAVMLAAGLSPAQLRDLMTTLDFPAFYSDYVALARGTDPVLGGAWRAGMHSQREMYRTFYDLLSRELGISGRPITFADLPKRMKLTMQVVASDLTEEERRSLGIMDDGTWVVGTENTPHMDVVTAMLASAAVPMAFEPMAIYAQLPDGQGGVTARTVYAVDGGTVVPYAAAHASADGWHVGIPIRTRAVVGGTVFDKPGFTYEVTAADAVLNEVNAASFRAEAAPLLARYKDEIGTIGIFFAGEKDAKVYALGATAAATAAIYERFAADGLVPGASTPEEALEVYERQTVDKNLAYRVLRAALPGRYQPLRPEEGFLTVRGLVVDRVGRARAIAALSRDHHWYSRDHL